MEFVRHDVTLGNTAQNAAGLGGSAAEGTVLRYWQFDGGHADTVLALHGLGGDHRGLREFAEGLHGVNLILPDLPGYGDSAPLSGKHTLVAYADAIERLRVHIGLSGFHLVGHSLGASIALLYASAHPDILHSLCLLNPVSTADNMTANLGKIYYRIGAVLPGPLARFWLASKPAVYLADRAIIKTDDRSVRRRILDEDYENYRRASVRAMVESFLSYYDTAFDQAASAVTVPSLLLTGDADAIAPPKSVRALAAVMPSATSTVLPGVGHLVPMERPVKIGRLVHEFLTTVRPAADRRSISPVLRSRPEPETA